MSIQSEVNEQIKTAMKAKDTISLEALRALKSAFLLVNTSGTQVNMTEADELKIVQKLVKQRQDSASIYSEQGRADLSEPELAQAKVLEQFLPQQMSEEELTDAIQTIINSSGANSLKDMGKVMGLASKELAGKADGKSISEVVKKLLTA